MNNPQKIPVAGPSITQREIDYVTDAVQNSWYEKAGQYVTRFEQAACRYFGSQFAIALPSCTSAIHLALAAKNIGLNHEVIVPDVTWIASAAPISYVGATPRFADIDATSWCITVESLKHCLTSKTRAIIAVDLYGNMPEMHAVQQFAKNNNLFLIEDAAEAIGSEWNQKKAGTWGDVGVFSFHGSKTLTTGEGGMLIMNDEKLYRRILFLRDHGRVPGDTSFQNAEVAFKYKMSDLQAAIGLAQIERVDELVARKREIFNGYQARLENIPGITLNSEPKQLFNSYWMTTLLLDPQLGIGKEHLQRKLAELNIDTRPFFAPLSSIPAYANTKEAKRAAIENETAYRISPQGINLPSGYNLSENDINFICNAVKRCTQSFKQKGKVA